MAKADLDLFNEFWLRTEREADFERYNSLVRQARPFALSDEIDEMIGEMALRDIDDVRSSRHLASARLPYPVMWIEHGNLGFGRRLPPVMFGDPIKTGWLLKQIELNDGAVHGFEATRISRVVNANDGELAASLYPIEHTVITSGTKIDYENMIATHREMSALAGGDPVIDLGERTVWEMHAEPSTPLIPWGGCDAEIEMDMPHEEAMALMRASPLYGTTSIALNHEFMRRIAAENFDPRTGIVSFMRNAARDQISELRYLVAALALLNEVPVEFIPYKPSGTVRMGGRLRPFMSSSLVSITVPQSRRRLKDIDKLLQAKGREAQKKARHEVRGHYRHVKKLPLKNPDRWERFQRADGSWVWRTFIAHHMRGSAELGWVDQRYQMVPKHQGHSENDRLTEDDFSSMQAS